MSDISSYSIQSLREITQHLLLLVKSKCLLSARLGNNESYITTILEVNEKKNVLVLDYGPKEELNQLILKTGRLIFDTDYQGIKVSFTGSGIKKTTYRGDPAFSMEIPKALYWMQRREYYRVKSPMTKASYCQIVVPGKKAVNLKLYDISLTGIALLNVSKQVSEMMIPGSIHEQCKLVLADVGQCAISFEVRAKYIINPEAFQSVQRIQKIGCRLVKVTRNVEDLIQRYMNQIQRAELHKDG